MTDISSTAPASPQPGDVISDSAYCDLELEDNTYGWERDTNSGQTQWVYKPNEAQNNSGAEDGAVAGNIGGGGVADPTAGVNINGLNAQDKTQLENARAELKEINEEIEANNIKLNNLEYQITVLQDEIEENLNEAIEKSEEIAQEQKEAVQKAVNQNLNNYTEANGEMTYEEFMNNLTHDVNGISQDADSKLTSAVRRIIEAESKFDSLNGLLSSINGVITDNKELTTQAQAKQGEIQTIVAKATEADTDIDKNVDEVSEAQNFDEKNNAFNSKTKELENLENTALKNLGINKDEISKVSSKLSKEAESNGESLENVFAKWRKEEQEQQEQEQKKNK